jgi:hypothetical protein
MRPTINHKEQQQTINHKDTLQTSNNHLTPKLDTGTNFWIYIANNVIIDIFVKRLKNYT